MQVTFFLPEPNQGDRHDPCEARLVTTLLAHFFALVLLDVITRVYLKICSQASLRFIRDVVFKLLFTVIIKSQLFRSLNITKIKIA